MGWFDGILIVFKDNFDVVGWLICVGLLGCEVLVEDDVYVVVWLCVFGVLFIGKMNMDEGVLGVFIDNLYFGIIYNLYCYGYSVGGLFGGVVVVVVVGLVVVVVGLDSFGLICIFVSYCGVYVFKFMYGEIFVCGLVLVVCCLDVVGLFVCGVDDFIVLL